MSEATKMSEAKKITLLFNLDLEFRYGLTFGNLEFWKIK